MAMKVVYNRRYGGFSLSAEAREWLIARRWRYADKLSEPHHGMVLVGDVPRHDPLLVECVETLGARASGECAALAIETVERAYEITEYDGNETVHERYVSGYTEEDVAQRVADAVATARAEAALAEREACAQIADDEAIIARRGSESDAEIQSRRIAQAIRARTTTATLSTDTLAAIAEARGLRVVEPELLAGLELPVLRWGYTAAHESEAKVSGWHLTAADRNWALIHESGVKVLSPRPNRASETDNRRAAEAALCSLGVAFRVEDGGVL